MEARQGGVQIRRRRRQQRLTTLALSSGSEWKRADVKNNFSRHTEWEPEPGRRLFHRERYSL